MDSEFRKNNKKYMNYRYVPDRNKLGSIEISVNNMISSEDLDIYEFGVHQGNSLLYIYECSNYKNVKFNNLFGFDSFIGFPDFTKEKLIDIDVYENWGNMNFDVGDIEKTKNYIKSFFIKHPILIDGFFEDVLKDNIVEKYNMKPASLIHIDCDLYTSTMCALEFMFRNNLIIKGTIIKYDEWGSFFKPGNSFGEERAHKEIENKYGSFDFIAKDSDKAIFRKN